MTRNFDLGDILSITEGSLVSPRHIAGIYDILGHMTGENLYTHALPRAATACRGPLLEQHPRLAGIEAPWRADPTMFDGLDTDHRSAVCGEWLTRMKAIHGDELAVTPLVEWHHIDPLQELAEMSERPDRIIVVAT